MLCGFILNDLSHVHIPGLMNKYCIMNNKEENSVIIEDKKFENILNPIPKLIGRKHESRKYFLNLNS